MEHINIEIKAHCSDPEKVRNILLENEADFKGMDHQIDTYFNCETGRLKLREGNIENSLIHYIRDDQDGPKLSDVALYKPNSGSDLKELLIRSNGIKVVVDKEREIYFIDNVKFHVDKVQKLGSFVEIEAINKPGDSDQAKLQKQCDYYLELLGIKNEDLIAVSYSDLLLKNE